ncbi:MAG: ATP-dependent DNA helicase [Burkholderiales bacterium]|jgi:ATP-dependent DNA helicase DinG|nr:ATP-dependent DNA helicase [Burkholderiales bacterium]
MAGATLSFTGGVHTLTAPLFSDIAAVFSEEGSLAKLLPGFRARPGQQAMAQAIAEAIRERRCLIAEAGTGTGKTFAYLVPALTGGGKVIISTGTKTLQDQLFERDLPLVRDALKLPLSVALLKGRSNYLCLHRLAQAQHEDLFPSKQDARYLKTIVSFAHTSLRGDRGELADIPDHAGIWPLVTSTRDNCLGAQCAHFDDCFVTKARKEALDADVVVINHHLFFADALLREEGLTELLPACNTVILDEAHQLPDIATVFFGERIGGAQLLELARDAEIAVRAHAGDLAELPARIHRLVSAVRQLRLAAGEFPGKFPAAQLLSLPAFTEALQTLTQVLDETASDLGTIAERSEELGLIAARAQTLSRTLQQWCEINENADDENTDDESTADDDQGNVPLIRWADLSPHGWQLYASPLSVAPIFRNFVENSARSWILTSATLSVAGQFTHYQHELGLENAQTARWDSPFDYEHQALLYVPMGLPLPNSREHTDAVIDAVLPVLAASRGRAFLLFTTHRALQHAHQRLQAAFAERGWDWPLLVQGEASRSELLERFRLEKNAVLLGAASFWEGVDVAGDALSLVVIDKLPFAPPDDPLLAARLEHLKKNGGEPFRDWQLPQAAINLKQGAGRLIRTETDRGVLMITDPRLVEKAYGKRLWRSLPPMRRTRELEEVVAFFEDKSQ